jgi:hypothetical protein
LLALASLDRACRDHCPDVSATLTTTAFDRSSSRWLGISDLIADPEGPSFISRTVTYRRWTGDTRDTRPNSDLALRKAFIVLAPPIGGWARWKLMAG